MGTLHFLIPGEKSLKAAGLNDIKPEHTNKGMLIIPGFKCDYYVAYVYHIQHQVHTTVQCLMCEKEIHFSACTANQP